MTPTSDDARATIAAWRAAWSEWQQAWPPVREFLSKSFLGRPPDFTPEFGRSQTRMAVSMQTLIDCSRNLLPLARQHSLSVDPIREFGDRMQPHARLMKVTERWGTLIEPDIFELSTRVRRIVDELADLTKDAAILSPVERVPADLRVSFRQAMEGVGDVVPGVELPSCNRRKLTRWVTEEDKLLGTTNELDAAPSKRRPLVRGLLVLHSRRKTKKPHQ